MLLFENTTDALDCNIITPTPQNGAGSWGLAYQIKSKNQKTIILN